MDAAAVFSIFIVIQRKFFSPIPGSAEEFAIANLTLMPSWRRTRSKRLATKIRATGRIKSKTPVEAIPGLYRNLKHKEWKHYE